MSLEAIEEAIKQLQVTSEIGKTKQAEKINPIYAALQRLLIFAPNLSAMILQVLTMRKSLR